MRAITVNACKGLWPGAKVYNPCLGESLPWERKREFLSQFRTCFANRVDMPFTRGSLSSTPFLF
jgi:hypothetical protein